ncbi:MAG: hypothetical protein ACE366_18750 [Bradymonadia bacterium]
MPTFRYASVLYVLWAFNTGCMKTSQYRPAQKGRAYLYVEQSRLAVFKDNVSYGSDNLTQAFSCDGATASRGFTAQTSISDGEKTLQTASMINVLGILLPPLLAVSPYFIIKGSNALDAGQAALVDAVNMHNDAESCFSAHDAVSQVEGRR